MNTAQRGMQCQVATGIPLLYLVQILLASPDYFQCKLSTVTVNGSFCKLHFCRNHLVASTHVYWAKGLYTIIVVVFVSECTDIYKLDDCDKNVQTDCK